MRNSIIVDFNNEFVFAQALEGQYKGKVFKIPRDNVRPPEWIAIGERIWWVEHNIWNFEKMFDKPAKKRSLLNRLIGLFKTNGRRT